MNWGYRSSAYDPDPSVLTGSIPGFAEMSNLYMEYCVHGMHMDLQIGNQNTENCIIVAWPSNSYQNVNSLSSADLADYSGNVRAKSVVLGPTTGQSGGRMKIHATGLQLVGNRFKTDLDYSAPVSTNPAQLYYINIGVYDPVANFAYGVVVKGRVIYDIEFFKLRQLET
jgi:hypothetical protein